MTRRFPLLAWCAASLLIGMADARADTTAHELFDTLPTLIHAEAESRRLGKIPPSNAQSDPSYLLSFFRNARENLENNDETSATQQLRQLEYAAATDSVRDTCEAIVTKLRKERADKEAAASAEATATLRRAGQAVLTAKTPKDLDPTLRVLSAASEKRASGRGFERGNDFAGVRLQNVLRFVTRWQDYLLALARNDTRAAPEQLRGLVAETEVIQILDIPRSEIASRIPPTNPPVVESTPVPVPRPSRSLAEINATIEAALDRLKTLDDLAPVLRDLTALSNDLSGVAGNYGGNAGDLHNIVTSLEELQNSYLEVQAGVNRWQGAWFTHYSNTGAQHGRKIYIVLRAQLFALTLPRILGGPDTEKPAPDERVDAFLERLIAEAKTRGDWPAVARGVECRHYLATNAAYETNPAEYANEAAAFKAFFAGQNFERAAQYEQAVASYSASLASGSQEIPVALLAERLAAIKKAHPAEYARGEGTASPFDSTEDRFLRRFRRPVAPPEPEDSASTPEAGTLSAPPPTPSPTPAP